MLINVGHEIAFVFPEPTALIVMLYLHPSRDATIEKPERLEVDPAVPIRQYIDSYGNRCGALSRRRDGSCFATTRSSRIAACPICRCRMRRNSTCKTCRKRSCCSCWPAAIARWTAN